MPPTSTLPGSDLIPKTIVWLRNLQLLILIIGNDGKDGLHLELQENLFHLSPDAPIHRRATIVEADQISSAHTGLSDFTESDSPSGSLLNGVQENNDPRHTWDVQIKGRSAICP